jgi:AcrR family transcriptional regulator
VGGVSDTRDRIVTVTAELFRRNGYTGTGLKEISGGSGAPVGSLYHFFPGGKEQLAAEVLRESGAGYQLLIEAVMDNAPDLVTGTRDVFAGAAEVLRQTDYADACPIATVALEVASTNDHLRQVTAGVFEQWIDAGTARFRAAGLPPKQARELALVLIGALEGAFVLARAAKSTEALDATGRAMAEVVRASLAAARLRREQRRRRPPGKQG